MKESGNLIGVLSISQLVKTEGLLKVHVQPLPIEYAPAGATAEHEATHAVTALATGTNPEMATIIGGKGYLGLTKLSGFNALAAAAPHGMGMGGTGHDMMIVSLMGHNSDSVARAARSVAQAHAPEIAAVAGILQKKKTVNSFEIHEAYNSARIPTHATVIFEKPDGSKTTLERQEVSPDGNIHLVFDRRFLKPSKETVIAKNQNELALAA